MRLAVVVSATLGAVPGVGFIGSDAFGIAPAEARVFTRKRVNGRWITGRFVSKASPRGRLRVAARSRAAARETEAEPVAPPMPPTRAGLGVVAASTGVTLAAASAASPASGSATAPMDERMLKLQAALKERARSIVMTSSADAPPAPEPSSPAATGSLAPSPDPGTRAEPRSVAFDFQSGLKTTVFANGASVQEKFDIPSLKGLAAPPPAGGAQAGPGPKSLQ